MADDNFCIIYVTAPSEQEAFRLAETAVQDKFAACANVSSKISSIYWWDNVVQSNDEFVIIFKTTKDKYAQLEHMIKKMHSYENPCIIMLDISDGSKEFLNWISSTVNRL